MTNTLDSRTRDHAFLFACLNSEDKLGIETPTFTITKQHRYDLSALRPTVLVKSTKSTRPTQTSQTSLAGNSGSMLPEPPRKHAIPVETEGFI
jgi:hypothetical protein